MHWNSEMFQQSRGDAPVAFSRPRKESDLTAVLLELARAERGFRFWHEGDPKRRGLVDRAYGVLISDIERSGTLTLRLAANGRSFQSAGTKGPHPTPASRRALEDLAGSLADHAIERLDFSATLTRTAVESLLDLLVAPAVADRSAECFAERLAARDASGIQINELENGRTVQTRPLASTSPRAAVSLAQPPAHDASERRAQEAKPSPEFDAPSIGPGASSDRRTRLRARLIELEATVDEAEYRSRSQDLIVWAMESQTQEGLEDALEVLSTFADHAIGFGGRAFAEARVAEAAFRELASGCRLDALIDRATETDDKGVRAAQLLLQLGPLAIPALLDRICHPPPADSVDRRPALRALILTQGESALAGLIAAMNGPDEARARVAIRLAGELQNPDALPALVQSLRRRNLEGRLETIRALSLLPGEESKKALTEALASDLEAIAAEASRAIAATEGSEAVPMLLDVLEASVESHRTSLGRTLIEVLGRLGDERAVPRLSALLERRPVFQRAHWHSIQLAAIDALCLLPTRESRRALERAARHGAGPIKHHARERLVNSD